MWHVYLLKSVNKNWYYVGSTSRLEIRVQEHNLGKVKSTLGYRPLKLVFTEQFTTENEARAYERKIKQRRKEKEKIIRELKN